jgi:transposase
VQLRAYNAVFGEAALKAYSMDLRERVMVDVDGGLGTKAAAEKYRVSPDWVRKLKRLRRETGSFGPRQQRVSHATKLDNDLPRLEQLLKERPDARLRSQRQLHLARAPSPAGYL